MRCAACGARNPDSASWCTQCYEPFADADDERSGLVDDEPSVERREPPRGAAAAPGVPPTVASADVDGSGAGAELDDERFRNGDDGLEWRCGVCTSWNPLEIPDCAVCGAGFARAVDRDEDDAPVARGTSTVLVLSAVLPGAGHIALGRTADGAARAVMYVLWLGGALALLRAAAGTPSPALPAAPLGIGALALWVLSALDAVGLAEGSRDQLLTPRVFLWLVVGVIGALIAAFVPGLLRITDLSG